MSKKWWKWTIAAPLLGMLFACSSSFAFKEYAFGPINDDPQTKADYEGYYRMGDYAALSSADHETIDASLSTIYSYGNKRHVLPSTGEDCLHVIAVSFSDYDESETVSKQWRDQLSQAFFGDSSFNQYESLSSFYDKSSFHRLHVKGTVAQEAYPSPYSYASLQSKTTARETKAALNEIYHGAIRWYNSQGYGDTLSVGDAIYFVYLAPYAETVASRSSMLWAFTINEPAPVSWSSYFMMNPREDGSVDAHTFIHEFGHMLGLVDYYDQNATSSVAASSPMGRMDMMDCSLGDHNAFSKMLLGWNRPYVPTGSSKIHLRPSQGNGDCVLLPLAEYNGTPFDEYLLLEFYTPTYLNYADSALRSDPSMSLMKAPGIKAYHVDGRLGVYNERGGTNDELLSPSVSILTRSLDFHADNSGSESGGAVSPKKGSFLIQGLDASSSSGKLLPRYVYSDHSESIRVDRATLSLRNSLFHEGMGIDGSWSDLTFHDGFNLAYGFCVERITSAGADIAVFPLGE